MSELVSADVVVDGHRISYRTTGDGPPLMLVPGIAMSGERWIETGYVDALASEHRLILVDPLGHGRSEKAADPSAYSGAALTRHLLAVLDQLNLDCVAAWGYSRGASMTAAAAASEPGRFTGVVLGGMPLFDVYRVLADLGLARTDSEYDEAFARSAEGDWEAFWSVFPLDIPEATRKVMEARNDVRAITAASVAIRRDPFVFGALDVPALAYWGAAEIFHDLNVAAAAEIGDTLSAAQVAGAHAEAFQHPAEAIAVVKPFLDELP